MMRRPLLRTRLVLKLLFIAREVLELAKIIGRALRDHHHRGCVVLIRMIEWLRRDHLRYWLAILRVLLRVIVCSMRLS